MNRSPAVRVRAFALMLALLGGGLGLPLFDSLVFHGQPGAPVSERTLVDVGGKPTHAQVCPLQQPAVTDGCLIDRAVTAHLPPPDSAVVIGTVESPIGSPHATLPPSRAPPLRA